MALSTNTPTSPAVGTSSSTNSGGGGTTSVVFCEELDFTEIELLHVVGQGTYGVVKKAIWREKTVAVKIIEGDMARKAFLIEVRQLSRVKHENIVNLYGACTKNPVCLVMEYAEGGSLHKVLHCPPKPAYKAAHAISWMLQCAEGVEYLHSLKPRALVHRDLKPLNLLLIDSGRKLKICDFGTACEAQSHMTNNKGSAQWMAPEVFEGSKYSEKCDVFSWGIMLWEVLTRRKPFEEVGGTAYSVMWAVHSGQRPPPIQNCPKPLEVLMTRCWDKSPIKRPAMSEVVVNISRLMKCFKGADEPLIVRLDQQNEMGDEDTESYSQDEIEDQTTLDFRPCTEDGGQPIVLPALPKVLQDDRDGVQQSAPASLGGSEEDLTASLRHNAIERIAAGGSGYTKGHRRTGSYDTSTSSKSSTKTGPGGKPNIPSPLDFSASTDTSSYPSTVVSIDETEVEIPTAYLALNTQFQPLRPFPGSRESAETFREHCQLAEEYIKIQEEITLLLKRKQDLITELNNNIKEAHQTSRFQEYQQLLREKEHMQNLHRTLKSNLDAARNQRNA